MRRRSAPSYLLVPESLPEPEPPALPLEPPLVAPVALPAPPDALGEADDPEDLSSFFAFLDFFLALALGLVSAVASVAPAAEVPDVAPVEPLPVVELPVALGGLDAPEVESVPEALLPGVDEPDAPEEVSLLPEALEPELPLAPEEPEVDEPGCEVLDGTELEVPLLPVMPASLPVPAPVAPVALCDLVVDEGSVALVPDCANAMDDTDATTISDSERRVVFNVMSNSF